MSNKMYVNWMDIVPITLKTYEMTNLYKNTKNMTEYNKLSDWDPVDDANINLGDNYVCDNIYEKASGLYIGDIYNTIVHDLYNGIKDIKWTIYDIPLSNKVYPIIVVLHFFFNLDICLSDEGADWDNLTKDQKQLFTQIWNDLVEGSLLGNGIMYGTIDISNDSLRTMLRGIILSFDKISDNIDEATDEKYITVRTSIGVKEYDEDESDDEGENIKITFSDVVKSLESVKPKFIYTFISQTLQKLKNTWYGVNILNIGNH
jgi:hypothetical protein